MRHLVTVLLLALTLLQLLQPVPVVAKTPAMAQVHHIVDTTEMASRQTAPERALTMTATAYAYTGHRTKTGTWPQRGTVAVDPRVIKLGTRLWVEGYGVAIAADTGGLIKGNRVDVYLESEVAAREWGMRPVTVRILN